MKSNLWVGPPRQPEGKGSREVLGASQCLWRRKYRIREEKVDAPWRHQLANGSGSGVTPESPGLLWSQRWEWVPNRLLLKAIEKPKAAKFSGCTPKAEANVDDN